MALTVVSTEGMFGFHASTSVDAFPDVALAGDKLIIILMRSSTFWQPITVDGVAVDLELLASVSASGSGRTIWLEVYAYTLTGLEEEGTSGFFEVYVEQTNGPDPIPIAIATMTVRADSGMIAFTADTAAVSDTTDRDIAPPALSKTVSGDIMMAVAAPTHTLTTGSASHVYTTPFETLLGSASSARLLMTPGYWAAGSTVETISGDIGPFPDSGTSPIGLTAISLVMTELTLEVDETDDIVVTDTLSIGTPDEEDATDTLNLSVVGAAAAVFPKTLSDVFAAVSVVAPHWIIPGVASDGVGVTATLGWIDAPALRDTIATTETLASSGVLGLTAGDGLVASDAARLGLPSSLTDGVDISLTVETVIALRVVEALGLGSVLSANAIFGRAQIESVTLADSLRQFFSGELLDQVGLTTVVTDELRFRSAVADALGLTDTPGSTLVLRVNAADTVDVTPEMALQFLYRPNLTDGVELSAAYVAPDSSITTWSVNAKTGATAEYDDYAFNSFAASGVKYLAASDTGLYELNGDDDDGVDVIGRLKSGFLSFAGSRFSGFRAAYIGVRGPGDYVFRLITGDDKTYDYAVNVRRMETTKILMGKGIRSSYFAFELISTGQDFDLDFVEFVPARAGRRV